MRYFLLARVGLTGMVFTSCTTYQPQPLEAATRQIQWESRRLTDPGLGQFLAFHNETVVDGSSWSLSRLTLAALYFNPELDVARAQRAEMVAEQHSAETRPNPTLTFAPGYNQDTGAVVSPWILDYALNFPIAWSGQRRSRRAEAQAQFDASDLALAAVAWRVKSQVRQALVDLHAAEARLLVAREQAPVGERAVTLMQQQVDVGELANWEASPLRMRWQQIQLERRSLELAVTEARSRLAEAMGMSAAALEGAILSFADLMPTIPSIDRPTARGQAVQNRLELRMALAEYEVTQAALQMEVARQYPGLNLGPGYQLDQGEGKWTLGIDLTLPVFDHNRGPIEAAEARRTAQAARFAVQQQQILAEVDRASAGYATALANVVDAEALQLDRADQLKAWRARADVGEVSPLELAIAAWDLTESQRTELEVRIAAEEALGRLEDAIQKPLGWPDATWRESPR